MIIKNIFPILIILQLMITPLFATTNVPRKLFIAYQSETGQSARANIYFEICQAVTDYLGLLSDYFDISTRTLPDDQFMSEYRAIISVSNSVKISNGIAWLRWLNHQCQKGKKIIILGQLAGYNDSNFNEYKKLAARINAHIGFVNKGMFSNHQGRIRFHYKDPERVEYERKYPVFPLNYEQFQVSKSNVRVWLSIKRKDLENSESAVVLTSPNGAFARYSELYWMDPVSYKKKWYINPFIFFEEALATHNLPRPDPTTLNGSRLAFSHIDGDAFSGPSRIDPSQTCAEMVRDQVLKKYDYPVTVSVIVAEISPSAVGNEKMVELAKNIFALPNVEPASHAYSHPYYWNEHSPVKDNYSHQYGIMVPGYTFDSKKEIVGSTHYITQKLSPPNKPCRVMLWSGACDPTERELKHCKAHGIYNMNGGDTVYDNANDSYTSVAPIYRKVGKLYQIHCGQANENILTNLWEGPYYGYREIVKTMKKTDMPRRLKAIDIYYHFYSGEYESSLNALQSVYEWVLEQDVALVYTSEYIQMAEGFLQTKIHKNKRGHYVISNYHHCLTIRFDHASTQPDIKNCVNVLGYIQQPQGLYVSLKPNTQKAVIAFLPENQKDLRTPYVEKANGWVMDFQAKENNILIVFKGFGKGYVRLAGLKAGQKYVVNSERANSSMITADSSGRAILGYVPTQSVGTRKQ